MPLTDHSDGSFFRLRLSILPWPKVRYRVTCRLEIAQGAKLPKLLGVGDQQDGLAGRRRSCGQKRKRHQGNDLGRGL